MADSIYLDNHSTTAPSPSVIEAMQPFLAEHWGLPTQPHGKGQELQVYIQRAYDTIYASLGLDDNDRFILTSSGTEAINHVIFSVFHDVTRETGKSHFLTTSIDEAPAVVAMGRLEQLGCATKLIPAAPDGSITVDALADEINPRTVLLSMSWANGLTGVVNPLADIVELCHSRGILVHVDATHAVGKLFLDFQDIGVDFISFSGKQLHGPRGVGGLIARGQAPLSPFIFGGQDQAGMRGGSLNIPGLVGLAQALADCQDHTDHMSLEVARLRDKLENGICEQSLESEILFADSERLPNCTALTFPGIANDALLFSIAQRKLQACFGGGKFQRIGLVLEASGIDPVIANTALSFALSRFSTEEEIDQAISIIAEETTRLRKMSLGIVPKPQQSTPTC